MHRSIDSGPEYLISTKFWCGKNRICWIMRPTFWILSARERFKLQVVFGFEFGFFCATEYMIVVNGTKPQISEQTCRPASRCMKLKATPRAMTDGPPFHATKSIDRLRGTSELGLWTFTHRYELSVQHHSLSSRGLYLMMLCCKWHTWIRGLDLRKLESIRPWKKQYWPVPKYSTPMAGSSTA